MTHCELIKRLGGVNYLRKALKLPYWKVHNWTRPGRAIPSSHFPSVIKIARRQGLSMDDLSKVTRVDSPRWPASSGDVAA